MSTKIVGKKIKNTEFYGYLLDKDGIEMVVSMRDLYASDIVNDLLAAGYKYYDYYGKIENEAGVFLSDLVPSEVTDDDCVDFYQAFEDDAYTEQQMLDKFTRDMTDLTFISFREPVEVRIKTRAELCEYLEVFRQESVAQKLQDVIVPLNAICAKEALFTVEEIEADSELIKYFNYMATRRTFTTRESFLKTEDFLVKTGALAESDKGNVTKFLEAYNAWGPEGLNVNCIEMKTQYDVEYPIMKPYTGSIAGDFTLSSFEAALRRDRLSDDMFLSGKVACKFGYGLTDKQGNVYYRGKKVSRLDILERQSEVFLTSYGLSTYDKLRRNLNNWKTPYQAVAVAELEHIDRVVMIIHTESGQLYAYRMDAEGVALVSNRDVPTFASSSFKMKLIDQSSISLRYVSTELEFIEYNFFRKLMYNIAKDRIAKPMFKSTVEMCIKNGLNYEQALDYAQYLNDAASASWFLHNDLPSDFVDEFKGDYADFDDLSRFDKLRVISENLEERSKEESPDYFDPMAVLGNTSSLDNPNLRNVAEFMISRQPAAAISSILDFSPNMLAGEFRAGNRSDLAVNSTDLLMTEITTCALLESSEINIPTIDRLITDICDEKYFELRYWVDELRGSKHGCLKDYCNFVVKQLCEASSALWINAAFTEMAAVEAKERRHMSILGWRMCLKYSDGTKTALSYLIDEVKANLLADNARTFDKSFCIYDVDYGVQIACGQIINAIWAIRFNNMNHFTQTPDGFILYVPYTNIYKQEFKIPLRFTNAQYNAIQASPDFKITTTTLYELARYAVTSSGRTFTFNTIISNAIVDPWFVKQKEGYAPITVFNGYFNYIKSNIWETTYKNSMPGVYNAIIGIKGRFTVGGKSVTDLETDTALYFSLNNNELDKALFSDANTKAGFSMNIGKRVPNEFRDYYLGEDKTEGTFEYTERFARYLEEYGNIERVILKSDIHYNFIADLYGYNIPTESYSMSPVDNKYKITTQSTPFATDSKNEFVFSSSFNVYEFKEYELDNTAVLQGSKLFVNGFNPSDVFIVSKDSIIFKDGAVKFDDCTKKKMDELVQSGILYQLSSNLYYASAVNGVYLLEV